MRKVARASGYRLPTAVEEFDDNSISKNATKIVNILLPDIDDNSRLGAFCTIDNGCGMTEKELHQAFAMAKNHKERNVHDIGSFHMGMKTAAMSMSNSLTILSRPEDGKIVGLHADFQLMAENNTFKPTDHCDNVNEEWATKYISRAIYEQFVKNPTGTLVYCSTLLPGARQSYSNAFEELRKALGNCYSTQKLHANATPFEIVVESNKSSEIITPTDLFYDTDPDKLDYPAYETNLLIYRDANYSIRIFEENTMSRKLNKTKKSTGATKEKPKYLEYKVARVKKTTCAAIPVSKDSLPDTSELLATIPVRIVQVSENAFKEEKTRFLEDDPLHSDRKGNYFIRGGIRTVAAAFNSGFKKHDRVAMNTERQRVRIDFPSSCDELVGCKFNKQMQDQMIPCELLGYTLRNISNSVFSEWNAKSGSISSTPETLSVNGGDSYQEDVPEVCSPETDLLTVPASSPIVDTSVPEAESSTTQCVDVPDTTVLESIEHTPESIKSNPPDEVASDTFSQRNLSIQSMVDDVVRNEFLSQDDKDKILTCLRNLLTPV
jgi:hypothetical protein